jgi:TatD DNase family protein
VGDAADVEARADLVDAHCHLDFAAFDPDRDAVLARAAAAGVRAVVVPGTHPDRWAAARALVAGAGRGAPRVVAGAGVHPECLPALEAAGRTAAALASLEDAARQAAAAGGGAGLVGECGLDGDVARGLHGPPVSLERQRAVLDAHVEVARALGLPLVLHVWRAHGPALEALARHAPRAPARGGPAGASGVAPALAGAPLSGVVHSYSGPAELVPAYLALGLHLSFAASVTRSSARRPRAAARAVPRDRLLVETDAPAQVASGAVPRPAAGDPAPDGADASVHVPASSARAATERPRGEPAHVLHVAAAVAAARGEPLGLLAQATSDNARRLFGLPAAVSRDPAPRPGPATGTRPAP